MKNRKTLIRGVITLAAVAAVAGALIAGPVGAAAKPVTKAKAKNIATKVFNKNIGGAPFLDEGSVLVQAHQNVNRQGLPAGDTQLNSLSITAPSAGFLIINGSVYINNNDNAFSQQFCLRPRVDGANVVPGPFASTPGEAACAAADVDSGPSDEINIAYSVVHPVAAGAHTVTQDVIGSFDPPYDAENAHLVALFVPAGGVNTAPALRGTGRE
jgi:hypothetical protein